MTQTDDDQAHDESPSPMSPVTIISREEPTEPQRRPTLSLPRQIQECHEVICLDNLFTSQRSNVLELQTRFPNYEFIRHDVTEPYACEVDQIYNLACPASPVHYQYNPIKTTKISFMGAINVLGLAKRVKARVFHASTSEVYGDPEVSPQVESYLGNVDCTGVRACYDEGKRVAETLFFEYHRTLNVDIRVARIFNTYGPGMHPYDGRVVSNFIMQALQEAIMRFMSCNTCVGPMNLGNPHEMTIRELAEMIICLTNSRSRLVFRDLPNNDPKLRKPDVTLAKTHLGWSPLVCIEEGLLRTIAYFRDLDLSKYKRPTNNTAHRKSEIANQSKGAPR
ncbi:unnamed protein product [Peronospora belbahrii]|uniref:UDP-glucuronic acid decarboxylase 1 n=1 Tax=Peronospora belbahrii TaxID=622444 RepID=A0AAU9KXW5_9STRA|nr:unnamed protein product [Peronospora belbahrii]